MVLHLFNGLERHIAYTQDEYKTIEKKFRDLYSSIVVTLHKPKSEVGFRTTLKKARDL